MYRKRECVAMLLAGGQGNRLGVLTKGRAKPAVPFGGKYRIIDFTLSNCINSGIDTVGVLTQYQPLELNEYIGNGQPWDLDRLEGGVQILPPYQHRRGADWYRGTANAIYQNFHFIDRYDPDYVLILSGDHIYKMDYSKMLDAHKAQNADCTISVINVPHEQTPHYGILSTDGDGKVVEFHEKPKNARSTLASMGVYIFGWNKLKAYLESDEAKNESSHDFGKDVIPAIIKAGERVFAYRYAGYWRDVGTIDSLWQANMDLLGRGCEIGVNDPAWRICARNPAEPPHFAAGSARITNSLVGAGCVIFGEVHSSVIFNGVRVGKGAVICDSVIMTNTRVGEKAHITKAIVAESVDIGEEAVVGRGSASGTNAGGGSAGGITVVGDGVSISPKAIVIGDAKTDDDVKEVKAV